MATYFEILESVSHLSAFLFKIGLTWWGVLIVHLSPKVNFLLSSTTTAVAATDLMHWGHPQVTGSNIFDRKATGCQQPLCSWVSTPKVTPLFTLTNRWNGFSREGKARAGVVISLSVCSLTWLTSLEVHRRWSGFPWASFWYKSLLFCAYELIHKCQYPTNPKNFLSSSLVWGEGKDTIPSTRSGPILYLLALIKWPKYLTLGSIYWSFPFETRNPSNCRWLKIHVEKPATFSVSSPDMRISSTYWSRHNSFGTETFSGTCSKIWPKRLGESMNPWGKTVHWYHCFRLDGIFPLKGKYVSTIFSQGTCPKGIL